MGFLNGEHLVFSPFSARYGYAHLSVRQSVCIDFSEVYETESGDYEDSNSFSCYTSKKIKLSVYGLPAAPTKTGLDI